MLGRLSIGARLVATVVLATLTSLLVVLGVLVSSETSRAREALVESTTIVAEMLAVHSTAALLFDDADTARETLLALRAEPDVVAAGIYYEDGVLFAPYTAGDDPIDVAEQLTLLEGHALGKGALELTRPIVDGDELLGYVWLRTDTRALTEGALRTVAVAVGLLLAATLLALASGLLLRRSLIRPLAELTERSRRMAEGDLRTTAMDPRGDELGALAEAYGSMGASLSVLVSEIRSSAQELGRGARELRDMGEHVAEESRRQQAAVGDSSRSIADVALSLDDVSENVHQLADNARSTYESMSAMDGSVSTVVTFTEGLAGQLESVSSSTTQLSASVAQVAAGVGTLEQAAETTESSLRDQSQVLETVVENAHSSRTLSQETASEAERGSHAVQETVESMREIETSFESLTTAIDGLATGSKSIVEIVSVIEGVADETQLLSLNASIIAAQAGEQGRAFSVVAEQVKELAARTSRSTREIRQLVSTLLGEIDQVVTASSSGASRVERGVSRSLEAGQRLRGILEGARGSVERVDAIVAAAEAQTSDLARVREAMSQVRTMVEQTRGSTKEQSAASREIARLVEVVRGLGEEARDATVAQRRESEDVTRRAKDTVSMTEAMMASIEEQRRGSQSVRGSLGELAQIADENIQRSDRLEEMVRTWADTSVRLERAVGRFRIAESGPQEETE